MEDNVALFNANHLLRQFCWSSGKSKTLWSRKHNKYYYSYNVRRVYIAAIHNIMHAKPMGFNY